MNTMTSSSSSSPSSSSLLMDKKDEREREREEKEEVKENYLSMRKDENNHGNTNTNTNTTNDVDEDVENQRHAEEKKEIVRVDPPPLTTSSILHEENHHHHHHPFPSSLSSTPFSNGQTDKNETNDHLQVETKNTTDNGTVSQTENDTANVTDIDESSLPPPPPPPPSSSSSLLPKALHNETSSTSTSTSTSTSLKRKWPSSTLSHSNTPYTRPRVTPSSNLFPRKKMNTASNELTFIQGRFLALTKKVKDLHVQNHQAQLYLTYKEKDIFEETYTKAEKWETLAYLLLDRVMDDLTPFQIDLLNDTLASLKNPNATLRDIVAQQFGFPTPDYLTAPHEDN